MKLFLGVTGASGGRYALDLLETATRCHPDLRTTLVFSEMGARVFAHECGRDTAALAFPGVDRADNADLFHPLASGTRAPDAGLVAPCSADTAAKIAAGIQDTLLLRVAGNLLKLRRPLVLLVREMPLSTLVLRNLHDLSQAGATIVPASPHFYHAPQDVDDLIHSVTGYLLDLVGLSHDLKARWEP